MLGTLGTGIHTTGDAAAVLAMAGCLVVGTVVTVLAGGDSTAGVDIDVSGGGVLQVAISRQAHVCDGAVHDDRAHGAERHRQLDCLGEAL